MQTLMTNCREGKSGPNTTSHLEVTYIETIGLHIFSTSHAIPSWAISSVGTITFAPETKGRDCEKC
jgi:hypothetical protein